METRRLLIADADPALLEIYRAYLVKFGFEVATARSGRDCLKLLRKYRPDVLIVSLELKGRGADGILEIIRKEMEIRPIPVVVIAKIIHSEAVRLRLPATVELLEKDSFQLPDLKAAIKSALRAFTRARARRRKIFPDDSDVGLEKLCGL